MRRYSWLALLLLSPAIVGCAKGSHSGGTEADAGGAADPEAWARLQRVVGDDLRQMKRDDPERQAIVALIQRLIPGREYRRVFDYVPWYVWEFPAQGRESSYVLFEADTSGPHPGSTPVRLTLFSAAGRVLSETQFTTAHRCYLRDVALSGRLSEGYPVIVLKTGSGPGPGPDIGKQYYARIGDRFDLVRLEAGDRAARRNRNYITHFTAGPAVPVLTEDEWEAELRSDDRFRVLRALVWLGGAHYNYKPDEVPDPGDEQHEDLGQVLVVRSVRQNAAVVARLQELAAGTDLWQAEAAKLAMHPEDLRWGP